MTHVLRWSFGEPREEQGELIADFYYLPGKHATLRIPWPVSRFAAAGNLPLRQIGEERINGWNAEITAFSESAGRLLYQALGAEAQTTLIRFVSGVRDESPQPLLYLQFPTPTPENRERCLALEDLSWELLHDGEEYITRRYSLPIVRTHIHEEFLGANEPVEVTSWGILLVSPFVEASDAECRAAGLSPLAHGKKEIAALHKLEKETHGLIRVRPPQKNHTPSGICTLADLEQVLLSKHREKYQCIHFIGHGILYDDEPCLCFQKPAGGIEFVSVGKLQQLFDAVRDQAGESHLPSVLFLNACSSSLRGRYSAGFAAGLHELGISVLGYQTEIPDDEKPLSAALGFYCSLCMDQSLQYPHRDPNIATALEAARSHLRNRAGETEPIWGRLRAYLPQETSFLVQGRNRIERLIQKQYTRMAHWMNPLDYTDHLAVGFLIAIAFGVIQGVENLALILPKTVLLTHLTYMEITSDMLRIFLIGPLSFLAAAVLIAWQTYWNYRFLNPLPMPESSPPLREYFLKPLTIGLSAGLAFMFSFSYSFIRLDLLTTQTASLVAFSPWTVYQFWFGLRVTLVIFVMVSLGIAGWFSFQHRISLHSYRTYYTLASLGGGLILLYSLALRYGSDQPQRLIEVWIFGLLATIAAYTSAAVKILKEICWRASHKKKMSAALTWRKLIPLFCGGFLILFGYFLLEESVRFEAQTIYSALSRRVDSQPENRDRPQETNILERALRQRAIQDIPERVRSSVGKDWLLSVVEADSLLYQAQRSTQSAERKVRLQECSDVLKTAEEMNPEVQYKDYFCNIQAMAKILTAELTEDPAAKRSLYEAAIRLAKMAVQKEEMNYAYLHTLALAESYLGSLIQDRNLLQQAESYARRASWSAFFLRSSRADEVQKSIDSLTEFIHKQISSLPKSTL